MGWASRGVVSVVVCLVAGGCGESPTTAVTQAVGTNTIVSLTFDDTLADQAQVADLAAARGMRVTFFINSPRLDHTGYLTRADVLAFQAAGHEIGGHTLSHADLPTLDPDEAKREVCNDRLALLAGGFAVRTFAYPFGDDNAAVDQIAADCNYNSARDVGGLVAPGSCAGCPFANTIPPDRLFSVRTPDSIKIDTTLDTLEGYVLQAEQHGGGWVPLVFHHVCDGCNSLSVSPATLAAFLDWLAARQDSGTVVQTMGDVIGGPVQPGVPGPPPGGGHPGLVLQNPSLEVDANGDQVPDCWQRGGSGINTATFTLESPGFDGNVAQRIDVTALTSGARRLVIKQDIGGTCAPTAYPGHSYTVTAAYKSNVQPHFSVYYRDQTNTWSFLAQGPALPASATYVRGSYTTPPYPAGTTGISVGLSILSVGSLTMDAFTLVDTDTTAPNVSFSTPADGATVSGTVPITIDASDAGGLASVELLVDGNPFLVAGPPYTFAWDTTQIADSVVGVAARATDLAGNVAVTQSHLVTIANAPPDTTPPVTTVACNGAPCTGYYPGDVTVTLSAIDSQSAVAEIRYTLDGSDPRTGTLYAGPFVITSSTTLLVSAMDTHGNRELPAATTIAIDRTVPTVAILCNGGPCPTEYTNQAIAITLAATGGPSGIAEIRYTLDGSDPTTGIVYTGAFSIASPATVTFVATSGAGIVSAIGSQLLQIDTIAPTAAIASPADGAKVTGKVAIVAAAADNARLVRVRFYVDGTELGVVTAPPYQLTWSPFVGSHRLAVRAEDAAGNATTSASILVTAF